MGPFEVVDLSQLVAARNTGDAFDYAEFARTLLKDVIPVWQEEEFLENPGISWGGFVANAAYAGRYHELPDDPYEMTGQIFGDGPLWVAYALNAIRKGRVLARHSRAYRSSLALKNAKVTPDHPVESAVRHGDYRWGDFLHGGAEIVGEGPEQRLWSVSAFLEGEDRGIAALLGELSRTHRVRMGYAQ